MVASQAAALRSGVDVRDGNNLAPTYHNTSCTRRDFLYGRRREYRTTIMQLPPTQLQRTPT